MAVSDTHANFKMLEDVVLKYKGDIFIHAGDFTHHGREKHFRDFFDILDRLQFRHKIVIAGNHEIMMDNGLMPDKKRTKYLQSHPCSIQRKEIIE